MPELAGLTASVLMILMGLIFGVLPMLAFPYLALRFRDSRAEKPDPELGIKAGYYFLFSLSLMLILFGLTMSTVDILYGTFDDAKKKADDGPPGMAPIRGQPKEPLKKEFWTPPQRVAAGLITSGAFCSVLLVLLIRIGTNDSNYSAARRTFVGARLAVSGMVIMVAVTALSIVLFWKKDKAFEETSNRAYEMIIAVMIVWLPTFILHLVLMRAYSSRPYYSATPEEERADRDRPRRSYDD